MRRHLLASAAMAVAMATGGPAFADMAAAERWVDEEFQPSVLTREEQLDEMEWFVQAAEPYRGMEINIVAEAIPTHDYEAEILTRAFEEITGIRVNMQIIGEGDVVQALQTQMQTGRNIYDMYVNDADLIGMHSRLGQTVNLDEWMAGEGADVTLPTLDVEDFFGRLFATGPDGSLWQLPDQQFANLYWFRKDWFDREDFRSSSRSSTATSSASRSTGRPTRISPSSSPSTCARSTACGSTATWTTASGPPTSAGG
jgi:glycerol transport system substrate-binding protein